MPYYKWPDCAKTIKAEINTVQSELERLLHKDFVAFYLLGSLALGGFNPARSDIDLLVVTQQRFDALVKKEIITLLLRMSRVPAPLDIAFLAQTDLQTGRLETFFHFTEVHREYFQQALHSVELSLPSTSEAPANHLLIDLFVLPRQGVTLSGPPPQEVLPAIDTTAFETALHEQAQALRKNRLHDPIAFVLNSCRILAYQDSNELLSKDQAGEWGLAHLPEHFHPLIQQVLALYRGERLNRPVGRLAFDDFATYTAQEIH